MMFFVTKHKKITFHSFLSLQYLLLSHDWLYDLLAGIYIIDVNEVLSYLTLSVTAAMDTTSC